MASTLSLQILLYYLLPLVIIAATTGLCALHWMYGLKWSWQEIPRHTPLPRQAHTSSPMDTNTIPTFSVLSQNTWCLLFGGGSKRRERLKLLIENIRVDEPTFVCLQELYLCRLFGIVMLCGDCIYVIRALANLGYVCCNDPTLSMPKWLGFNNGLMMFYQPEISDIRIKLKETQCVDFESNQLLPIPKYFVCKGFIYGVFEIHSARNEQDSCLLLVVNTHFENKVRKCKLQSIQQLSQHLKLKVSDYDAIHYKVCLGDFNICSNWTWEMHFNYSQQRLYSILADTLDIECGLKHDIFNGVTRTYRPTEVDKTAAYDHMFVNERLQQLVQQYQVKDWKNAETGLVMSDHFALFSQFRLDHK